MRVSSCDPVAALRLLALALVALAGCQGSGDDAAPAEVAASAPLPTTSAPRRPTRRHYLARTAERCEVYSVDRDVVSPAETTPCPQELQVGERIRIAGMTCLREGRPERTQPVVCPGALTKAEERDREARDAGD
ncbi:hypothetical protein [Polyangium aurulentum]|uniref:hypothetical protein n=1 Tax=Polyangium aurulentum TaxID=2567896 RepID=UPI0010AE0B17|nr:hypothetical protein [Polyangium aurulentum]UQA62516.1 hypothetical protein E8A73_019510 [Polyangium aurulentum]